MRLVTLPFIQTPSKARVSQSRIESSAFLCESKSEKVASYEDRRRVLMKHISMIFEKSHWAGPIVSGGELLPLFAKRKNVEESAGIHSASPPFVSARYSPTTGFCGFRNPAGALPSQRNEFRSFSMLMIWDRL